MAIQRNGQEHYGYTEQQVETKTKQNGQRDDTQRERWGDRWDTRSKQKSKKASLDVKKIMCCYWLIKINRVLNWRKII